MHINGKALIPISNKHAPGSIVKWPSNKVDKLPSPSVRESGTVKE